MGIRRLLGKVVKVVGAAGLRFQPLSGLRFKGGQP